MKNIKILWHNHSVFSIFLRSCSRFFAPKAHFRTSASSSIGQPFDTTKHIQRIGGPHRIAIVIYIDRGTATTGRFSTRIPSPLGLRWVKPWQIEVFRTGGHHRIPAFCSETSQKWSRTICNTRIFKDGNGRELNDFDGSGASGCGLRQSGWALEHRGLRWDGFGCSRAFVDRLRPRDCWGLGETTESIVSVSKSSAPPCPAGLDLVKISWSGKTFKVGINCMWPKKAPPTFGLFRVSTVLHRHHLSIVTKWYLNHKFDWFHLQTKNQHDLS